MARAVRPPGRSERDGAPGQAAVGRFDASTGLPIWVKTHHPSGSGGAGGHYDAADGALAMYTDNGTNLYTVCKNL